MKSPLRYLLDTHALLWAAAEEERLGPEAARILASTPYERLAISDVSLQEIGYLLHTGKVTLRGSPAAVLGPVLDYVQVLPISLQVALAAPALRLPHGDPFDRIIAATAKVHRLTLLSRDATLAESGLVPVVW
ncbi:MAG: type II toxin-antitoxin system VapC family toxin [Verrucomicrobia bacterium]|nr:type II toxin-antitoxin system VapC family toxin [Verrucomicrobiota bacterium]